MKFEQNETLNKISPMRVSKRNAYHQAGYTVSIYLGNKQKKLPAVHFQIAISSPRQEPVISRRTVRLPVKQTVKLEGGRLIESLPYSYDAAVKRLSPCQKQQCQDAFEADVINILTGSLAEAKYVALRDGEVFNANLVYLGALRFYGGSMDLQLINEYMACLMPDDPQKQQSRLAELFLQAYSFINDKKNWFIIANLAETLTNFPKDLYTCDELIHLIESANPMNIDRFPKTSSYIAANLSAY
jgi:hypothetical protein